MKIKNIISALEEVAPPSLQESYDNSGLIVGSFESDVQKALISLDTTEAVIDEAIESGCQLVISHHPIVFSGMKRFNGSTYIERVIMKAIKNDIAIYAIHTNLDNVLVQGVNSKIAEKLDVKNTGILQKRKGDLKKLITFVPEKHLNDLRTALCAAGAGHIGNYDLCTFSSNGVGTFRGNEGSNPQFGLKGKLHFEDECRIELIFPAYIESKLISALKETHPYEEVAYDIIKLDNSWDRSGAGLIGELEQPMSKADFLVHVKNSLSTEVIRYTETAQENIQKVAICGGSGSFLLSNAIGAGADAFITGDFKYHQFFDSEERLMICDVGHYESEQFTIELLGGILSEKIPNFAVIFAKTETNPVKYFYQ